LTRRLIGLAISESIGHSTALQHKNGDNGESTKTIASIQYKELPLQRTEHANCKMFVQRRSIHDKAF
jgi:hypothetical protein